MWTELELLSFASGTQYISFIFYFKKRVFFLLISEMKMNTMPMYYTFIATISLICIYFILSFSIYTKLRHSEDIFIFLHTMPLELEKKLNNACTTLDWQFGWRPNSGSIFFFNLHCTGLLNTLTKRLLICKNVMD